MGQLKIKKNDTTTMYNVHGTGWLQVLNIPQVHAKLALSEKDVNYKTVQRHVIQIRCAQAEKNA
ncbi:hypothetical protein [Luteirhabdus pelagi]|uniref:hypothetical protein n=1 Tax=Luteirhabdus pelagi TaxID=2792783 RepID=UPI001939664A|nr:hypothetical protein [Luteirhabdus pelagi]